MYSKNLSDFYNKLSSGKDRFDRGIIVQSEYCFIFKSLDIISTIIGLEYSSGLCRIGSSRNLLRTWKNDKIDVIAKFKKDRYNDLIFVGAVKSLVPSLKFGGDEQLFEVGMFIKTPDGKFFPATLYWGQGGLTLGCWQEKILGKFVGYKKTNIYYQITYINFSEVEKENLVEALELAIQKVPISDFEGEFWDENGGTRMGVKSGIPFIEDIPIEEDVDYTLGYYDGKFMDIMYECASEEELNKLEVKIKARSDHDGRMIMIRKYHRMLIERCYEDLLENAYQFSSRYAFQALGIFLMENGAMMTHDVRKLILENSHWRDERHKTKGRQERAKRRMDLFDFQTKILEYKEVY